MDQQLPPKSYIQFVFKDIGSIEFVANMDGVVPLQLFAISDYLHFMAENGLMQEKVREAQRAQQNKIVVPGMDVPDLPK